MPWMKKDLMSLRGEFVHLVETELLLLATLCQRFGISRKTGYKWLARDRDEGRAGVADRSRRREGLLGANPGRGYKLSKAFRGYPVGVRPLAVDGQYEVLFCQHRLTTIDVRTAQSPREHR